MNQFTVPQFIDVEDKIIGPITSRQFVILMVGFMLAAVFYRLFDFSLFLVTGLTDILITSVFAFARINGRPFHFFALNILQTWKKPNVRVWNHMASKTGEEEYEEPKQEERPVVQTKNFSSTRLSELALIVDTQGAFRGLKAKDGRLKTVSSDEKIIE
jgi:hypothetical protein